MSRHLRSACVGLLFALALSCPSTVRAEEPLQDAGPGSELKLSDRFFSDSSADYEFIGKTEWETGLLKLAPASAVVRRETLTAKFDFETHLWPKRGNSPQQASSSRLVFLFSNGFQLDLVVARQKQQGRLLRQVVALEKSGGRGDRANWQASTKELRRFPAFSMKGDVERWRVKYRNGLMQISCNNQVIGTTFTAAMASWCNGVAVQQDVGQAELTQFTLHGIRAGYTEEERSVYAQTIELRQRAEAVLAEGDLHGAIKLELSRIPLIEELARDRYAIGLVHGWVAERYMEARLYQEAEEAYESAYQVLRKELGRVHPESLRYKACYVHAESRSGDLDEALQELDKTLAKLLEIAGPGSNRTLVVADVYSKMLFVKGEHQLNEEDHIAYLDTIANIVRLAELVREPDDWYVIRLKRKHKNVAIRVQAIKDGNQQIVDWFQEWKKINDFLASGQSNAALESIKNQLKEAKEIFGEDHSLTASSLSTLSRTASNCGDAGLSILSAERALKYWRKHAIENDLDLACALTQLGASYSISNRYNEAEKLFAEAHSIFDAAGEMNTVDSAECMLEQARNLIRSGDRKAAKPLLETALQVVSIYGDPVSEIALKVRERLADLCRVEGDIRGAERYMEQQRALITRVHGPNSAPYIELLLSEAKNLFVRSKFEEAAAGYREAMKIIEKSHGKQSRLYEAALHGLTTALAWQGGDRHAAETYLRLVDMQQAKQESLYSVYPESLQFGTAMLDRKCSTLWSSWLSTRRSSRLRPTAESLLPKVLLPFAREGSARPHGLPNFNRWLQNWERSTPS